jgi:D-alanyl-D-alanine carboxypeptidase
MNRRELLNLGITVAVSATAGVLSVNESRADEAGRYAAAFPLLDEFVAQYLRDENAPGLTLALADANGVQRICAYGLDDLARRRQLNVDELFHIGSITKSFTSVCLLQLVDEGKLDLHRPINEYLPWLRFDKATRPISAHDLLTHSAALPDGPLFPPDPAFRHRATAAPGTFFHYCNMGYEALGHLLVTLDGRPLPEIFRARILVPLNMSSTEPVIRLDAADRIATSYWVALNDRPYPRYGRLTEAQPIAMSAASGCIASCSRDMGAYLTMLINKGGTPGARVISEKGFALFSTAHIPAKEFGEGVAYGYGIAVDTIDGHSRIRHTGGMLSFASALEVDLDSGVGVFASVNSMEGDRPRPVAEYALRLMRACRETKLLPNVPAPAASLRIERAADFAGQFAAADGRILQVMAEGDRLYLLHGAVRVPLEPTAEVENGFTVLHPDYAVYSLVFSRAPKDEKGPFLEVGWGEDWYVSADYKGAHEFAVPKEWRRYIGHYRSEDRWIGSNRVVLRAGKLWLNGVVPLEPASGGRFYLRDDPASPEWVSFFDFVNGYAMRMCLSGASLARV